MDCKERNIRYRHVITYKENELWMYDAVEDHSMKSGWIKDILKDYLKGKLIHIDETTVNACTPVRQSTSQQTNLIEADCNDLSSIFSK